jgi:hypothetical protein
MSCEKCHDVGYIVSEDKNQRGENYRDVCNECVFGLPRENTQHNNDEKMDTHFGRVAVSIRNSFGDFGGCEMFCTFEIGGAIVGRATLKELREAMEKTVELLKSKGY